MRTLALLSSVVLLSACAGYQVDPDPSMSVIDSKGQLDYNLASGEFECDHGHRVTMQRHEDNPDHMHLHWNGDRYTMKRDTSSSGLPRYEDDDKNLVWIELPWKGVLLDAQTQRPLANECTTS